ncbi:sulfotransferase family protein [Pseudoruegeria sp. SK021]|uniref:sulfotransferase family protein n=1 Tax=Pseudoruegeria sp. SK021 TaxID=1933035 RepID=UPI001980EABE|nr:sulfotransferase [Pseudoruegeria sp. SK021]
MFVNLTPPAEIYRAEFVRLGCTVVGSVLFGDKKYCNKVAQLRNAPSDADFVVCCDTDILFLRNIASDLVGQDDLVFGKIVDYNNPPIDKLRAVAALAPDLPEIPETLSDINCEPTLVGNFNGGLYILPGKHLRAISECWEAEALRLLDCEQSRAILAEFGWHTDQISFCFTLARLGLDYKVLPLSFNYPLHFPVPDHQVPDPSQLRIVHYHDSVDRNFLPKSDKVCRPNLRAHIQEAVETLKVMIYLDSDKRDRARTSESRFTFLVGFHRSGTSLLAAGCESVGYSIGNGELWAGTHENPKGYYENKRFVRLNEEILRKRNSDWDDIFFSFGDDADAIASQFKLPISTFLGHEYLCQPHPNYILKDPRIMQTYGIWRNTVRAMGHGTPEIVFTFRNPVECAESQQSRYRKSFAGDGDPFHFFGQDLRETLLLWYVYTVRFLATLEDERMIVVRYNDLISNPEACLTRISDWSGLAVRPDELATFSESFLDKGLRHHKRDLTDLKKATLEMPYVLTLYQQLEDLAGKPQIYKADIRKIVDTHTEPFADLLQHDFLGRLFSVPKQRWIHARHVAG